MANTLLTPDVITKEAQRILHSKLSFVGNVNRQYDDSFARSGAKIGQSLRVRLPNKYTTRTGATMSAQNTVNRAVTLPCATQVGVDMNFSSVELTMDIDDFSKLHIEPAMAQLASTIESNVLASAIAATPNYVGAVNAQIDFKKFQQAGATLTSNLAPMDRNRSFLLSPNSRVEFSDAVKGVFQSSDNIKEQYREGKMGRTGGFDVYESTLLAAHTNGAFSGSDIHTVGSNGITGEGNAYAATTTLDTDGWSSTTLTAGTIITIEDVYDVHPETKQTLGRLKRFTVVETVSDTAGDMDIVISPAIIAGGAYQNVSNLAANDKDITVLGTTGLTYGNDLAFHRDAFAFVTADLEDVSKEGAWGARRVYDGISMRIARQFDIVNDLHPCRIDILYGFVPIYPELACRHVYQLPTS